MDNKILDAKIEGPVTDVCAFRDRIVVSAYDRSLRMYHDQVLLKCVYLSSVVYKICDDGTNIVCGSQNGTVYVLDPCLTLVESFVLFPGISVMLHCANAILVGSWGKMLASVSKQEGFAGDAALGAFSDARGPCSRTDGVDFCGAPQLYAKDFVKVSRYSVSAAAFGSGKIAVAFENILKLYDPSFSEILSKTMPCNINTVAVAQQGVYVGLINGRIHFEHFTDSDECFIFNAHTEMQDEEKVFHSVNQLYFDGFLYSAGSDGRIYKWNVASRRCVASIFSAGQNIKKFLIHNGCMYVLLEDVLDKNSVGKVVYVPLKNKVC